MCGVALAGALATVASAQDVKPDRAIKYRQGILQAIGWDMGPMAAMVKGEKPYDQAAVDEALKQLDDTAKKLPTMFAASTKGLKAEGDYSSSPKIWEDKAGFDAKIAAIAKVVTESKTKIKDLDSLKATVPVIGKACGGCHETYRVKNS